MSLREQLEAEVTQRTREIFAQGERFAGECLGRVRLLRDAYEQRFREEAGVDLVIKFWQLKGDALKENDGCPLKPYFVERSTLNFTKP